MNADLLADGRRDPYATYARLREAAPCAWSEAWGGFVVTRYADVAAGFRDPRLSANRASGYGARLPEPVRAKLLPLIRNLGSWALLIDPPAHTRLRGLINKAFTPRLVAYLRPRIEALVESLLDDISGPELDLIEALANPLPVIVIGEMLGLPREDRHRLKAWSDALAEFVGGPPSLEGAARALASVVDMEAYFRAVLAERRAHPGPDLLSTLVAAEETGQILSEQELLSTCAMVLFGGHETTTNLIGNAVYEIGRHPEQRALLLADPSLVPGAVEETLRFQSPVQRMGRVALEDLEIAGTPVPRGSRVWLTMGAAHRDPAEFTDPDAFDVRRAENRHLAFGLGPHFCVGAALGRMEAQSAIGRLLARFPRFSPRLAEPEWHDNLTIRGFARWPLVT